jgi:hypothetical protein
MPKKWLPLILTNLIDIHQKNKQYLCAHKELTQQLHCLIKSVIQLIRHLSALLQAIPAKDTQSFTNTTKSNSIYFRRKRCLTLLKQEPEKQQLYFTNANFIPRRKTFKPELFS